jgi:hypothetical protein
MAPDYRTLQPRHPESVQAFPGLLGVQELVDEQPTGFLVARDRESVQRVTEFCYRIPGAANVSKLLNVSGAVFSAIG